MRDGSKPLSVTNALKRIATQVVSREDMSLSDFPLPPTGSLRAIYSPLEKVLLKVTVSFLCFW
jgi:hypothetical protein